MLKKSNVKAAVLIGVGMLLGYLAATSNVDRWAGRTAVAAHADVNEQAATCSEGSDKAGLLALAGHNERVVNQAEKSGKKPNILIIWGDDIGGFNVSVYNQGVMGYKTPNIDRIAKEGALFTDWYGQQSCTAGRAAFSQGNRRSAPAH